MKYRIFFSLVFIFAMMVSCKKDYLKYTKKPEYITSPSQENKLYFDAYDATLKIWKGPYEELYIPIAWNECQFYHVVS